jgi:hypothetical protein
MLTTVNQILAETLSNPCGRLLRPLFFAEMDRLRGDKVRQREEHEANPGGAPPPSPTPKKEVCCNAF